MRFRQVSEHIYALRAWMIVPIHVWLVKDTDGLSLVDAGISPMTRGILQAAERVGHGPIKRVLLTHGHVDHVGALPGILTKQAGGAPETVPVLIHEQELVYAEGREPYPGRRKAQQTLKLGTAAALEMNGRPIGGLVPYHTPGHSPGHVAYFHSVDGVLLAGDLFTSRRGELRPPIAMFTSDMAQAIESAEILNDLSPKHLEICHGEPITNPAEQLDEYRRRYA